MSLWSMQGAQRTAILMALLLLFSQQLDEPATAELVTASAAAPARAATPAKKPQQQQQQDEDRGPGPGTYLCLLTCAVVVARQIRKRGKTHVVLS